MLRIYVMEEQELYREVYQILDSREKFQILGISDIFDAQFLRHEISELRPDALIIGIHRLRKDLIKEVKELRQEYPNVGMLLLLSNIIQDMDLKHLLAINGNKRLLIFLRQSIDQIDQLCRAIESTCQKEALLDMQIPHLSSGNKSEYASSNQFSYQEIDMFKSKCQGYMECDTSNQHPRLSAVKFCLKTIGGLSQDCP